MKIQQRIARVAHEANELKIELEFRRGEIDQLERARRHEESRRRFGSLSFRENLPTDLSDLRLLLQLALAKKKRARRWLQEAS